MLIFGIFMLVIFGAAMAGLFYFLRWLKRQNPSLSDTDYRNEQTSVQAYFGMLGIDRGILMLTGGRYRVYVEAPSLNVPLMAEEEQLGLESRFASLLARINFPIQFYIQNRPLDMAEVMDELSEQYDGAPDNLREYAEELKNYLHNLTETAPIWVRRKLIVIPFEDPHATLEEAIKVLDHRARLVLAELSACGIEGRCLTTEEIAHVWYTHLNKNKSITQPFRNAVYGGHTQTFTTGGNLRDVLLQ